MLQITPTLNRKAIATEVGKSCDDVQERQVAKFMTHSVDVARSSYQHLATTKQAVAVYSTLNSTLNSTLQTDAEPPTATQKKKEVYH